MIQTLNEEREQQRKENKALSDHIAKLEQAIQEKDKMIGEKDQFIANTFQESPVL